MAAVVMIWPLLECPHNTQIWDYIFQNYFLWWG